MALNPLFHTASTGIIALIILGVIKRRNRKQHVPIMISAFVLDVLLLLAVELTRHALEKAVANTLPPITWFHIACSVMTLVLYVIMLFSGRRLLKGDESVRPRHKKTALLFFFFRVCNYLSSFALP